MLGPTHEPARRRSQFATARAGWPGSGSIEMVEFPTPATRRRAVAGGRDTTGTNRACVRRRSRRRGVVVGDQERPAFAWEDRWSRRRHRGSRAHPCRSRSRSRAARSAHNALAVAPKSSSTPARDRTDDLFRSISIVCQPGDGPIEHCELRSGPVCVAIEVAVVAENTHRRSDGGVDQSAGETSASQRLLPSALMKSRNDASASDRRSLHRRQPESPRFDCRRVDRFDLGDEQRLRAQASSSPAGRPGARRWSPSARNVSGWSIDFEAPDITAGGDHWASVGVGWTGPTASRPLTRGDGSSSPPPGGVGRTPVAVDRRDGGGFCLRSAPWSGYADVDLTAHARTWGCRWPSSVPGWAALGNRRELCRSPRPPRRRRPGGPRSGGDRHRARSACCDEDRGVRRHAATIGRRPKSARIKQELCKRPVSTHHARVPERVAARLGPHGQPVWARPTAIRAMTRPVGGRDGIYLAVVPAGQPQHAAVG